MGVAKGRFDLCGKLLHSLLLRHIKGRGKGINSFFLKKGGGLVQVRLTKIVECQFCTQAPKFDRQGPAYARTSSGNDDDLIFHVLVLTVINEQI